MCITRFPHRLTTFSKLLAAGAAVFLTVGFAPAPDGSIGPAVAFADKGGGSNGGGGNGGGGSGGGNSGGNGGGQAGSNRGTDARGADRPDRGGGLGAAHGGAKEGVAKGANRYNDMAGRRAATQERADDPASRHTPGREVAAFDDRQTRSLVARGWAARTPDAMGFSTHGQRVSTLVAVARELGLSPSLGALQANFGTFGEIANRVAPSTYATYLGLRQQRQTLAQAGAPPAQLAPLDQRISALAASLSAAVVAADTKPGVGPASGWATVDLDVNADGRVDAADLDAAGAGGQ
jgi:hypothetical protein